MSDGEAGTESDQERWQRQERRHVVPTHEVPGPISLNAVLGRTPTLVVVLLAARVFSGGIELRLMTRLRRAGAPPDSPLLHDQRGPVRADGLDDVMQLSVLYPDGRQVASASSEWSEDEDEHAPRLQSTEGSGSQTHRDDRYWLTPLPPPGDVTIVFSWPYREMPETRTVIPAHSLAQALASAHELWPDDPDPAFV